MDRLAYIAMTGARHIMEQQGNVAHNLANASTTGFRAQLDSFRAVPVQGDGLATRSYVVDATAGTDFTPGQTQQTGRDLDVAINGKGWLAVQLPDGTEAYTRHGSLKVSENGILQTHGGINVQGQGGPIAIPPDTSISISKDGTVASIAYGTKPGASTILGQIKLVNPPEQNLVRGEDGLFRQKNGVDAETDPAVEVIGRALEGSNVNIVDAMVSMISLARAFENQMNLLKNAENNAAKASQLLSLN